MKKDLLKILFGILVGLFVALLFRCDPECKPISTVETIKFVPVKVNPSNISYNNLSTKPAYVRKTTSPSTFKDTIIIYDTIPVEGEYTVSSRYRREFWYKDTSITLNGVANIVADSLYDFKFDLLNITYKEKTITHTIEAKRRMNLLLGADMKFANNQDFMKGVGFNMGVKTRKDFIIEAGYDFNFNMADNYKVGIKIPLLYRKK